MDLEITAESPFDFCITMDGKAYRLVQRGGEWRLDGYWIASRRIDWPEALSRALRFVTNNRAETAIGRQTP